MKKLSVIALALIMCLTLAACGPDTSAAQEALTEASLLYNEVAMAGNENPDLFNEDEITRLTELAGQLENFQDILSAGEMTQEQLDELDDWCQTVIDALTEIKVGYGIE